MAGTVHVVGAGLAGLAAAVRLAHAGVAVALYEAAPQAGGRCRSYHDPALGITIDNGNHLLLSANKAALGYVRTIGGQAALTVAPECAFPFDDLATGARWTLRPGRGRLPFWIFYASLSTSFAVHLIFIVDRLRLVLEDGSRPSQHGLSD